MNSNRIMKTKKTKKASVLKKLIITASVLVILCIGGICAVWGISCYVVSCTEDKLISVREASEFSEADYIIVLGCRVNEDIPSVMLADRLDRGVELYKSGAAPKLLMSGEKSGSNYDEPAVMKKYAEEQGVPSEDIITDGEGYSTYDTVNRAAEVFGAKRVVLVSQSYHLYRAVYIAEGLGMEARGVASDLRSYVKQPWYDFREMFARAKDWFLTL